MTTNNTTLATPTLRRPSFDIATARRFLAFMLDPSTGCMELRVPRAGYGPGRFIIPMERYAVTLGGWYDNPDDLVSDLAKLDGVSGYVTINPVKPYMMSVSQNRLTKREKDSSTHDTDIACFRWLFIDIDPPLIEVDKAGEIIYRKRPDGISSTDDELAVAVEARDQILADYPDIAECSIWGKSGNGAYIFARMPDYDIEYGHHLAGRALARLAREYEGKGVEIDVKCKNPSRIGPIGGTVKCKGTHTAARPHRLVTVDTPDNP